MTVWIKQGVTGDLSREARRGLGRCARVYERKGLDFFITSIREGNHSAGSFHYDGGAFDFKRQEILISELRQELGKDYDVEEYDNLNIFHVEYDPKGN